MNKTNHQYEVKIRTEKHGVYLDHGPFTVKANSKAEALNKALFHLKHRIKHLYSNKNKYKVQSWKNIIEDTIGSEISIITTRLD